jgi:branched-chain amino acid aminotransferase
MFSRTVSSLPNQVRLVSFFIQHLLTDVCNINLSRRDTAHYHLEDGGIGLFRPEKNIERMNASARRMVMPEVEPNLFFEALKKLILLDRDWIPTSEGTSLYIRPTMIANEPTLGVRPSKQYLFYIILSPVGAYYPEGFSPTRIYVSDEYVRAVKGGSGDAKTSRRERLYPGSLA